MEPATREAGVSTNATDPQPTDAVVAPREPEPYDIVPVEGDSSTDAQQQPSEPSAPEPPSKLAQVLLCFSLPANISRILRVEKGRASGDQLPCLHSIRVFGAVCIIWGHTYIYSSYYSGAPTY